ncbi:hypothetical protein [Microbacterium algeriense]|nr:hypothetical protein [Microbacterium algeriense]
MTVRTLADVQARCAIPMADSDSARVDELYPRESYSQWAREGLRSGLDHMVVWADLTMPTGARANLPVTHQGFRWFHTLLRAALEGAAQSLWLTTVENTGEATARLIRAVRDDLREQRLARLAMGKDVSRIDQRITQHAAGALEWMKYGPSEDRMPSYVSMIRSAALRASLDPNECEATWRVASAAAHGKTWAILDLQELVGEAVEWRPGQFHTPGVVDQDRLTDSIETAVTLLSAATAQLLLRNGYDPTREFRHSVVDVARKSPMKDGDAQVEALAERLGIK